MRADAEALARHAGLTIEISELLAPHGDARTVLAELDAELQPDTLLSGVVRDQAALHVLLDRIRDLGLELIDVHQIPEHKPRSERSDRLSGAAEPAQNIGGRDD